MPGRFGPHGPGARGDVQRVEPDAHRRARPPRPTPRPRGRRGRWPAPRGPAARRCRTGRGTSRGCGRRGRRGRRPTHRPGRGSRRPSSSSTGPFSSTTISRSGCRRRTCMAALMPAASPPMTTSRSLMRPGGYGRGPRAQRDPQVLDQHARARRPRERAVAGEEVRHARDTAISQVERVVDRHVPPPPAAIRDEVACRDACDRPVGKDLDRGAQLVVVEATTSTGTPQRLRDLRSRMSGRGDVLVGQPTHGGPPQSGSAAGSRRGPTRRRRGSPLVALGPRPPRRDRQP